jgi:dihydrofolate synthase/folylpolyglutamate synthase
MTYEEALEYIHGTHKFGKKLGLHNIRMLLGLMGDPQKKLRFVHIAGTNGKGSTSAFIGSILEEAGYRTGIYTSPYIQRFTERIRIGSREISGPELAEIASLVRSKAEKMTAMGENHPTEFEIITAIAFEYFAREHCDIVVLEVGLGGRFDSTNVIDVPELAVITSISLDHTERLGNTLAEIAFEKAGIIKPGGDVLVYGQSAEAENVFEKACAERKASLFRTDFSDIEIVKFGIDGQEFSYKGFDSLKISLLGKHQTRNAALSVDAALLLKAKGYDISEADIRQGLANTTWPGRMEVLSKEPVFIIDGAHNPGAAEVLRQTLDDYFPGKPRTLIMGVAADKDYKTMMEIMLPGAQKLIAVTSLTDRALPAADLAVYAGCYCNDVRISDTIVDAIRISMEEAGADEIICAFGSLYYIGAVRDYFGLKSGIGNNRYG